MDLWEGAARALRGMRPMTVTLHVTEEERALLKRAAKNAKLPVGRWATHNLIDVAKIEGADSE